MKTRRPWIVLIIIFGIYYGYVFFSRSKISCFYKNIFGLPCPGCGMTRSYLHLFQGDIHQAFLDHPLFLFVPLLLLLSLLMVIYREKPMLKKGFSKSILLILVLFWVTYLIRMFLLFPNQEPMEFYSNGLLPRLIHWLMR